MAASTGSSGSLPRQRAGRVDLVLLVLLFALLAGSAVAYALLLPLQREVFLNGVPAPEEFRLPRPADLTAAAAAAQRYLPLAATVVGLYAAVLVVVRWSRGRAAGLVAVLVGIAGHLTLLPLKPGLSIDLYSYLAHGYLAGRPDSNPYLVDAAAVATTPFGPALLAEGWMPVHPATPYGPLWTQLERLAVQLSAGDVSQAVLLLKVVVVVATVGTGLLGWRIAELVRPGAGPLAATAWLLNPVVVVEFGVEGHNDALAIFFTVLALFAALRGWALLAVVALASGTLVKYLPAVFAVPVLVLLFRRARSRSRTAIEVGLGLALSAGLAWLLWSPWWSGLDTFKGLRASAAPYPAVSPAGYLAELWIDPYAAEPSLLPSLALGGALLAVVLAASWGRHPGSWLAGCGVIAVAALAISPVYWPWYCALAIAVLAVRPTGFALAQVVVLTAASRYTALWGDLAAVGVMTFDDTFRRSAFAGITVPVAACAVLALAGAAVHGIRRARRGTVARTGTD